MVTHRRCPPVAEAVVAGLLPKSKSMKTKNLSILIVGVCLLALDVNAQTTNATPPVPTPPVLSADLLANVPTVPLAQETVGLTVGTVMSGASAFKNIEILDYSFAKSFFAGAELVNSATAGSVLESGGLRAGVYKSFSTARVYGYLGGRRDWSVSKWQGIGGVGLAYTPFQSQTNSVMQKFSAVVEQRIVVSTGKGAPPTETVAGIRYSF